MCFLEPLVCKRQVIGDHQQREIIAAAPILVKANHGLGTNVGINADKRIQNLAHAGPVCQRDVLQLCIHERKVRCKTADAGQHRGSLPRSFRTSGHRLCKRSNAGIDVPVSLGFGYTNKQRIGARTVAKVEPAKDIFLGNRSQ
jgi:hypothetical protein